MSKREKILLVDDDVDLVDVLRLVLEKAGYAVVVAHDAEAGLEKVEAERPDLILLDVIMTRPTAGINVVWELRRRHEAYFQSVPVIMLTALHDRTGLRFQPEGAASTAKAGEQLPIQDFIDKPVDPARLLERVQRALTVARANT